MPTNLWGSKSFLFVMYGLHINLRSIIITNRHAEKYGFIVFRNLYCSGLGGRGSVAIALGDKCSEA